jgi:hypothetical protein
MHDNKYKENNIIKQTAYKNGYKDTTITQPHNKYATENTEDTNKEHRNLVTFTYVGKETKFITKIFKRANIRIPYTTNNTTEKLLGRNNQKTRQI